MPNMLLVSPGVPLSNLRLKMICCNLKNEHEQKTSIVSHIPTPQGEKSFKINKLQGTLLIGNQIFNVCELGTEL